MASVFGHIAVAYAMGKTVNPAWASPRFWVLTVLCCLLPDVDVLGLLMGIPYEHVLGIEDLRIQSPSRFW
jgi:inner membrane protein